MEVCPDKSIYIRVRLLDPHPDELPSLGSIFAVRWDSWGIELRVIEILEGRLSSERVAGAGSRCRFTELGFQRQANSVSAWPVGYEV